MSEILGEDWSNAEEWGVWGIGSLHRLNLYFADPPRCPIRVDLNVAAALVGSRTSQKVDVVIGDQILATWHFTRDHNRGERSIIVPVGTASEEPSGFSVIPLDFRPESAVPINALDQEHRDDRALGLALFGIRRSDGD